MQISMVVTVALLVIVPAPAALGVCLNGSPSVEQEYRQSSVVFVGRVTAATPVPETRPFYEGIRYTVRVSEILRGKPARAISVFSENSSGRSPMDVGIDYLMFLSIRAGEPVIVDSCGNSGQVSEKAAAIDTVRHLKKTSR